MSNIWVIRNEETGAYLRNEDMEILIFSSKMAAENFMDSKSINREFFSACEMRR